MKTQKHLAFDLGASSGRAIVGWIDEEKRLRLQEVHRFSNHPYEENGRFYWDFTALCSELKTGLKKAFEYAEDTVSFSVDTWGVDLVFFRNGTPTRQPYCYRDPRFVQAMEDVHKIVPAEECFAETGIQILPFNTLYQLFADCQDHPEDFSGNAKALFMPDALLAVLTGEECTEYTIASTGAMLDPETRNWNIALTERLGIPANVLTDIVPPCTGGALLKQELCSELGIPQIPCIRCASHDTGSAIAALPAPGSTEHAAYISLGTWALLGAEIQTPDMTNAAYCAHYTNEGGAAGTIRFLTNITGTWLLQETKRTWNESGDPVTFAEMEQLAKAAKTEKRFNPNDPVFSAPGDMPERISRVCGGFASRGELLRCIYESLADCFAEKLKELEKLRNCKYEKLHILGGGTKDSFLMQLTANRIGIDVLAGPVEATAIGNILAQILASGELKTLDDCRALVSSSFELKCYHPEG